MTRISGCGLASELAPADALVFGVVAGPSGVRAGPGGVLANRLVGGQLDRMLDALRASASVGSVVLIPVQELDAAVPLLVGVGLGDDGTTADERAERLRRAAGEAARSLAGRRRACFARPPPSAAPSAVPVLREARAVAEGALLGAYSFDRYRAPGASRQPLEEVVVALPEGEESDLDAQLESCRLVCESVALARDLVNEPPNVLYPETFAEQCATAARQAGLGIEILELDELEAGGYGGIVAVGAGSARPPRLVRLEWAPEHPLARVALVGKGITYDSGGLDLKPRGRLPYMKNDMAGAAAVLAATKAAAELELPIGVVSYLPLAENALGAASYRPGDVLVMRNGSHVEIRNTDAEGRLVLADAISRAGEDAADCLVVVATLTGAQTIALGRRTCGAMGDRRLVELLSAAARRAGEAMWPMPLPEDIEADLRSEIADLSNWVEGTAGGMARGGLFVSRFVPEGLAWAHLDIAGPAYNEGRPSGHTPGGGTGFPTRTLVEALSELSSDPARVEKLRRARSAPVLNSPFSGPFEELS